MSVVKCSVVWMDDKIFSDSVQAATGYFSVLTFWDDATGFTVYALRKTKLAREAFVLFISRWCAYFGVPKVLGTDGDRAMCGNVAKLTCGMLGVEDRIKVPQGSHAHGCEHQQVYISEAIDTAEERGELVSPVQMELHVAMAQLRVDQQIASADSTCFQRMFGNTPNTVKDLLRRDDLSTTELLKTIATLKPMDSAMIEALRQRCEQMILLRAEKREQRSRYQLISRSAKAANVLEQDFSTLIYEGSKVSYKGETVNIVQAPKIAGVVYKVQIEQPNGKTTWVLSHEVKGLAADGIDNMLPVLPDIQQGSLVFYNDPSEGDAVLAGTVIETVDAETLIVQINQPMNGVATWLPRWEDPNRLDKLIRAKSKPAGCTAFLEEVSVQWICTVGTFTGPGYFLSEDTVHHLLSLGVELDLEVYDEATVAEEQSDTASD